MSNTKTDFSNAFPEIAGLPASDRHRLLQSDRRRLTLSILAERTTPISLDDLAASVGAREKRLTVPASEQQEHVKIALHHNHLPLMDDLGILDYDWDLKQVTA